MFYREEHDYEKKPLPGVSMETYEPSTLAVGGKHDDFHPKKSRPKPPIIEKGKFHTLSGGGNRIDIVKKVMKEKGLNLPHASKYVKEPNLYQKVGKAVKSYQPKLLRQNANISTLPAAGKSNSERVKEAYEWKDFVKSTANDGIDLVQKETDPFKHVKNLFGGDV